MIVVFSEDHDAAARWAAQRLAATGRPTRLVTGSSLASARRWSHRIRRGRASLDLELASGEHVSSDEVTGVLNRLSYLPAAWLQRIGGADREYVVQEMYAFYVSWLNCFRGPLFNPPTPQGLCGNWRHPSAWTALAAAAGLPTSDYRQSDRDEPDAIWNSGAGTAERQTFFVVDGRVVPDGVLPLPISDACTHLGAAAASPLLAVELIGEGNHWRFAGASVMPDLLLGGDALIAALASGLAQ